MGFYKKVRKGAAIIGFVAITAVVAGVEGYDIGKTTHNSNEITQNEERSIENRESLIEIGQKVLSLESNQDDEYRLPRMCICIAEDDSRIPKRMICPTPCSTDDAVRQCEAINPGYQCG